MKTDQSAPIPDKHREVLEHRLARVERGEEAFIDWSEQLQQVAALSDDELLRQLRGEG